MRKFLTLITSKALLTAILMLLQFTVLTLVLFYFINDWWIYLVTTLIVSVVFGIYILNCDLHPSYKLAWTVIVLTMPIFGVFAYVVLGRNGQKNRRVRRYARYAVPLWTYLVPRLEFAESLKDEDSFFAETAKYMETTIGFPAYRCDDATFFGCGEDFIETYFKELQKAERFIFMEYYIVAEGALFDRWLEILDGRMAAGVEVRLIYDDFGNFLTMPPRVRRLLKSHGIKTMVFNKFRPILDMSQNNRTHRKITVIDGKVGFTGGITLADEYINVKIKHGYWKDTAVMVKGACVANFTAMFLHAWSYEHKNEEFAPFFPDLPEETESKSFAQPFTDIPIDRNNTTEDLYIKILYHAKRYVTITTPYLLIDEEMKRAILTAQKSGVDVRIIVPHIPDKKWVFWLTKAFYTELVKEGVKVYEYTPGFIHAKLIVSDDRYAVVGTANMDYRSFFLQYENGVFFANDRLAGAIQEDMERTLAHSELMTVQNTRVNLLMRVVRGILRIFAPLV